MGGNFGESRMLRRLACRKVIQSDRLAAEAARASLEIWNQATGGAQKGNIVVVYRCKKCGELYVSRKSSISRAANDRLRPQRLKASGQHTAMGFAKEQTRDRRDLDIRYLIEEFDLG